MRAFIKIKDPEKVEVSLTMTMELEDWKALKEQLNSAYPSWKLSEFISNLISVAEKWFMDDHESGKLFE